MSATQQIQITDPYLLGPACTVPRLSGEKPNNLVLDAKYNTVDITTPIGRLMFVNVTKPRAVEQTKPNDRSYSCSIIMNPVAVGDIWQAIVLVANGAWKPEQIPDPAGSGQMVTITGEHRLALPRNQGGIHNPLRHGEDVYRAAIMKQKNPKDYEPFRGTATINAALAEFTKKGDRNNPPLVLDENGNPTDGGNLYSGCYGRLKIRVFAFRGQTNSGISVILQSAQFARHGERVGGFNALASAQAAMGAIPHDPNAPTAPGGASPEPGFGPNYGTGAPSGPPGAFPAGFAAPPAPPQQATQQAGFAAPPPGNAPLHPWGAQPQQR